MRTLALEACCIAVAIVGAAAGAAGAGFGLPLVAMAAVGWMICQFRATAASSSDEGCPAVSVPIPPFEPVIAWDNLHADLLARAMVRRISPPTSTAIGTPD